MISVTTFLEEATLPKKGDFVYDLNLYKHPPNPLLNRNIIYENNKFLYNETKVNCHETYTYAPLIRKYAAKNKNFAVNCAINSVKPLHTDTDVVEDPCNWLLTNKLYYNIYKAATNAQTHPHLHPPTHKRTNAFYMMRIVDELSRTYCPICRCNIDECCKYNGCLEYTNDNNEPIIQSFNVYEQNILELVICRQNENTGIISPNFIFTELKHQFYLSLDYKKYDAVYNDRRFCYENRSIKYIFEMFNEVEQNLAKYIKLKYQIHTHFANYFTDELMNYIGEFL